MAVFKHKKARRHWDDEKELWFFSIIDVLEILTDSSRPRRYWNDLKTKLQLEGSELSEKNGHGKIEKSVTKSTIHP